MKRIIAFVLTLVMLLAVGCMDADKHESNLRSDVEDETSLVPTETPEEPKTPAPLNTEVPETEQPKEEVSLSWTKAFRINTLPEGKITPDEIGFYSVDKDGHEQITNVAKEEVFAYRPERLPRTRTLEQYIPDNLDTLLVTLDYAYAHGYSRFSIPTTDFTYGDILSVKGYLNYMYYNDNTGVNTLDVQSFKMEDGKTLTYVLVTISALPDYKTAQYYLKGVEEAQKIVASVPEGSSEFQTALYLYSYLTDNVEYDYDDYYEKGKKILLYDALVKHKTVCAGYTEALYYLYNLAGIDCMIVSGYISDPVPRGYHIWNVARINGQYYQFDATWDYGDPPTYYRYFAVSDEYMMAHHTQYVATFSQEYIPECPESLFPEIMAETAWFTKSKALFDVYLYYYCLDEREFNPIYMLLSISSLFEHKIEQRNIQIISAEDGWAITNLPYREFYDVISMLMEEQVADHFCQGYFKNMGGWLAIHRSQSNPVGWRICEITENADGSILTKAYLIDETGAVQPASHLFRFKEEKISAFTEK